MKRRPSETQPLPATAPPASSAAPVLQPSLAADRATATWLALAVAAAAVLMRLPHLGWGLPGIEEEALPLKKAFEMWGWDAGRLQLDPQTAGWPSLSFYVHLLLQHAIYWVGRLSGDFADRYDFYLLFKDPSRLVVIARGLSVAAAGGVVFVAARLGMRLAAGALGVSASRGAVAGAGLLAGGMLAVSPLLYTQSRMITPDILLTLCAALAVWRIVDIYERGRVRDYVWAAVWIGLGASAKYSPILLVPALYAAHLLRLRVEAPAGGRRSLGLDDRRLWLAAAACAAAFALTSPFLLLDVAVLRRDVGAQVVHLGEGHLGHEERGGTSLYYLREVLAPALGGPGLLLAVAGLGWAAWRRRGPWLAVAICPLCLYLGLGFLSTQFDRYMLPLLLPLALGLTAAFAWLLVRLAGRPRPLRLAVISLLVLLALVPPARATLIAAQTQARPSTLQRARQFIVETLADPALVFAMEAYTPELPLDRRAELAAKPVFARLSTAQQQRLLAGPAFTVHHIPFYTVNVELAHAYYDLRHYLPADVIITSGAVRGRFAQQPTRFPRQIAFYADLDRYTDLLRTFAPDARTAGPEIRLYRLRPQDRERLRSDRGLPAVDFYREFLPYLHAPHFEAFVTGLAGYAYKKQFYDVADLYYQMLRETTPPGPQRRFQAAHAMAKLQIGRAAAARTLCDEALQRDPHDLQALVLLGLAHADLGDTTRAVAALEHCLALAAAGRGKTAPAGDPAMFDAPGWARRLLAQLQSRPIPRE